MGIQYYPPRSTPLPIVWRGQHSSQSLYSIDDIVLFEGSTYYATGQNINGSYTPGSPGSDWDLFASKGDDGDQGSQPEYLSSLKIQHSALTPLNGTVNVNFGQNGMLTHGPLSAGVTYTGLSYIDGVTVSIRVLGGASLCSLSFPPEWRFVSSKPSSIAANKTGVLSLTCFGTSASSVVAAWVAEA